MPVPAKSAVSLAHWMKGRGSADVRFGKIFAVIAVSILFLPFFLLLLWKLVQNWGWWRVKREKGDRIYVKTWHGWVDEDNYLKKALERGRLPGTRHCFGWKVTTAHLVHISWTPEGSKVEHRLDTGNKKFLRRLPHWIIIKAPNTHGSGNSPDVEMGIIPQPPSVYTRGTRSSRHITPNHHGRELNSLEQVDGPVDGQIDGQFDGPCEPTSSSLSHVMSGALRHTSSEHSEPSTVRRRTITAEQDTAWQANSSETSRATVTQFIMPSHEFRTPVWADQLFGHETARGTVASFQSDQSIDVPQPSQIICKRHLALGDGNREKLCKVGARRAVQSSPTFSPPFTVSAASGLHLLTTLTAGAKLNNLSDCLGSGSHYKVNAQFVPPGKAKTLHVDRTAAPLSSQSLIQRLKSRARPSITGLFSSIRRFSGQRGNESNVNRESSVEESFTISGDILQEYENEGSLDDAISYYTDSEASMGPVPRLLAEAIRETSSTVRPTSPAAYGFYYEDIRDYGARSITNLLAQNKSITPYPFFNGLPADPYNSSGPPRKRALRTSTTVPMHHPATPKIAARSTSPSSSRIPSMSLADAATQANGNWQPPALSARAATSRELRERLTWLDLRCTKRMKGKEVVGSLKEGRERGKTKISSEDVPRSRRALRRVGNFLGSEQQVVSEAGSAGKENRSTASVARGNGDKV